MFWPMTKTYCIYKMYSIPPLCGFVCSLKVTKKRVVIVIHSSRQGLQFSGAQHRFGRLRCQQTADRIGAKSHDIRALAPAESAALSDTALEVKYCGQVPLPKLLVLEVLIGHPACYIQHTTPSLVSCNCFRPHKTERQQSPRKISQSALGKWNLQNELEDPIRLASVVHVCFFFWRFFSGIVSERPVA